MPITHQRHKAFQLKLADQLVSSYNTRKRLGHHRCFWTNNTAAAFSRQRVRSMRQHALIHTHTYNTGICDYTAIVWAEQSSAVVDGIMVRNWLQSMQKKDRNK